MIFYKKAFDEFIKKDNFLNYAILSEKIGDEYLKINNVITALNYYKNAQKNYLNMDIDKYINITIIKIIPSYIENNNIKNIGKSYYEIAKLYKDNIHNTQINEYFKQAIIYLEIEKSNELLSCYIDFTYFLLECGNIDNAIYNLKKIISQMSESNLLLYRINTYIFLYLLCIMAKDDIILLRQELNKYCELIYRFINYPGNKFIEQLIITYENNNIENFIDLIYEYDKIYKLKPLEVKLLLIVKNKLILINKINLS